MIDLTSIIVASAYAFGLSPIELTAKRRDEPSLTARQVGIALASRLTDAHPGEIAMAFNRASYTCVNKAIQAVEMRCANDAAFKAKVQQVTDAIKWRCRFDNFGNVDVVAVARMVSERPRENAMKPSIVEIAAICQTFLEVWEVAKAGEELAEEISIKNLPGSEADQRRRLGISRAIITEMAAVRREKRGETA